MIRRPEEIVTQFRKDVGYAAVRRCREQSKATETNKA